MNLLLASAKDRSEQLGRRTRPNARDLFAATVADGHLTLDDLSPEGQEGFLLRGKPVGEYPHHRSPAGGWPILGVSRADAGPSSCFPSVTSVRIALQDPPTASPAASILAVRLGSLARADDILLRPAVEARAAALTLRALPSPPAPSSALVQVDASAVLPAAPRPIDASGRHCRTRRALRPDADGRAGARPAD